jgi:hypothetical protein
MKKMITVLILFITSLQSFSQTKSETEQWILDKLRTTIQEFNESHSIGSSTDIFSPMSRHRHYDYSFYFDSEYLVIEYKNRYTVGKEVNPDGVEEKRIKILIPVNNINEIKRLKQENVWSPKKYVTCDQIEITTQPSSIKYFNGGFEELKHNSEIINLSNENDENLAERLKKAIFHLKQFYPQKQKETKKETF